MCSIWIRHIVSRRSYQRSKALEIGSEFRISRKELQRILVQVCEDEVARSEMQQNLEKIKILESNLPTPEWALIRIYTQIRTKKGSRKIFDKGEVKEYRMGLQMDLGNECDIKIEGQFGRYVELENVFYLGNEYRGLRLEVRGFVFEGFEIAVRDNDQIEKERIRDERRRVWEGYNRRIAVETKKTNCLEEGGERPGGESRIGPERVREDPVSGVEKNNVTMSTGIRIGSKNDRPKVGGQRVKVDEDLTPHTNIQREDDVSRSMRTSTRNRRFVLFQNPDLQNNLKQKSSVHRNSSKQRHRRSRKSSKRRISGRNSKTRKPEVVTDTCAICLDEICESKGVLNCGHEYCFECIDQWTKSDNSCPLCKIKSKTLSMFLGPTLSNSIVLTDRHLVVEQELNQAEAEVANADSFCYVCHYTNQQNVMLVCDSCLLKSCHIFCLDPPMHYIPESEWYCDFCVREKGIRSSNPTSNYFQRQCQTLSRLQREREVTTSESESDLVTDSISVTDSSMESGPRRVSQDDSVIDISETSGDSEYLEIQSVEQSKVRRQGAIRKRMTMTIEEFVVGKSDFENETNTFFTSRKNRRKSQKRDTAWRKKLQRQEMEEIRGSRRKGKSRRPILVDEVSARVDHQNLSSVERKMIVPRRRRKLMIEASKSGKKRKRRSVRMSQKNTNNRKSRKHSQKGDLETKTSK